MVSGGPGDKAVFGAIRAQADVVLAGGGNRFRGKRTDRPGSAPNASNSASRGARRPFLPSRSSRDGVNLEPSLPLFGSDPTPLVLTTETGAETARRVLESSAEVIPTGARARGPATGAR